MSTRLSQIKEACEAYRQVLAAEKDQPSISNLCTRIRDKYRKVVTPIAVLTLVEEIKSLRDQRDFWEREYKKLKNKSTH